MIALRIAPMGDSGLLVETDSLDEAQALHDALVATRPNGITEFVPGAVSVLVRYAPGDIAARDVEAWIRSLDPQVGGSGDGDQVVVPVVYDGPDLDDVAALLGVDVPEVIRLHTTSTYRVAFTGFAPGFAYLVGGDPALVVPRRTSPRDRVPAGSVGLAGAYSGVYPRSSPGGWQLIGRAIEPMWDERRDPPALLSPGMRVTFQEVDAAPPTPAAPEEPDESSPDAAGLRVRQPGLRLTVQDAGRPGLAQFGVSASGAMDRASLALANEAVGNSPGTPALESSTGQVDLEACRPQTVAVVGGGPSITVRRADGRAIEWAEGTPIPLMAGDRLHVGFLAHGTFTYVAPRGGVETPRTLGSASTDTLSGLGPRALAAGDLVAVGHTARAAVRDEHLALPAPPAQGPVVIDAVPGPREDWFTPEGVRAFWDGTWTVSPQSDRVGTRLTGDQQVTWATDAELASHGMVAGAVEIPAGGAPVVLMADHPVTGGYPVIACVATHDLARLAQIPTGAQVRFRRCGVDLSSDHPSRSEA